MANLQAAAVITAIDRASPVFMRVAQSAHRAANVYTGLAGRLDALQGALRNFSTLTALPGVMALGALIQRTQDFEKALVGVQIAGIADNMKDRVVDFEKIRDLAKETQAEALKLSKALALPPTGFVKAGEAALKMGLSAEKVAKIMEMSGAVHIQDNEISQPKVAEFLGTIGKQFGLEKPGMDYNTEIVRVANQWLAVANMTRTSASRLEEGLRQFAPLYGSLGESFADTASLVGAMTQAGLMDTESGTALKSAANRFLNLTHQGRDSMIVSGLWDAIQKEKLIDMSGATARQAMLNLKTLFAGRIKKGDENPLRDILEEGQRGNLYMDAAYQQRLVAMVNKITGARDAPTMEANQEKVMTAIMTGGGRIQMTKILQLMAKMQAEGKLTDAQLGKIFEGRHIARYKALFQMMGELEKLQKATAGVTDEFTKAGNKLWTDSDAGKWAATIASLDRAFVRLRQSEGIRNTIGLLEQFAATVATMPQGLVEFGGKALVASVGIGALGLALAGVARAAVTIAGNPLLKALFLGGGAIALGQPGMLMGADRLDARDMLDPTLFGPGAPIWQTFDRITQVAEEAAKTAQLIGQIGGEIVEAIRVAFGEDPSASPLFKGLQSFNDLLDTTAKRIKAMREGLSALMSGDFSAAYAKMQEMNPQAAAFARWHPLAIAAGSRPWQSDGMLRDLGGKVDRVEVSGAAEVNVKSEVTVRVEGPGTVVDTKNGQTTTAVPLNTGKSMPDTGIPMP